MKTAEQKKNESIVWVANWINLVQYQRLVDRGVSSHQVAATAHQGCHWEQVTEQARAA